jgi:hypothetical protein
MRHVGPRDANGVPLSILTLNFIELVVPASFIRRSYYLLQMPGWGRRLRTVIDWTLALLSGCSVEELPD